MSKNKIFYIAAAGLLLSSASLLPASASDPAISSQSAGPFFRAKQVLGACAGAAIGLPVCFIRKPIDEEKYGIAQMTSDSHKRRLIIPAALFWAPFAAAAGILEAPFCAGTNSLANFDKPFSKEQFSLGDNEPPAQKPAGE